MKRCWLLILCSLFIAAHHVAALEEQPAGPPIPVQVHPDLGGRCRNGRWIPVSITLGPASQPFNAEVCVTVGGARFIAGRQLLDAARLFRVSFLPNDRADLRLQVRDLGTGLTALDQDLRPFFRSLGAGERLVIVLRPPGAAPLDIPDRIDKFDLQKVELRPDQLPAQRRDLENVDAVIIAVKPTGAGYAKTLSTEGGKVLEEWVKSGGCLIAPAEWLYPASGFGRQIQIDREEASETPAAWEVALNEFFARNAPAVTDLRVDAAAFQTPDPPGRGAPEARKAARTVIWAFVLFLAVALAVLYRRNRSRLLLTGLLLLAGAAAAVWAWKWVPRPEIMDCFSIVQRSADGTSVLTTELRQFLTSQPQAHIDTPRGLPEDTRILSPATQTTTAQEYSVDTDRITGLFIAFDTAVLARGTRFERTTPGENSPMVETDAARYVTRAEVPAGLTRAMFIDKTADAGVSLAWIGQPPTGGPEKPGRIWFSQDSFLDEYYPEEGMPKRLLQYAVKGQALTRPGAWLVGFAPAGEGGNTAAVVMIQLERVSKGKEPIK